MEKWENQYKLEHPHLEDGYNKADILEWLAEKVVNKNFIKPDVTGCLYAFLYNSCIHESSWATISLHYSKKGAEKAMQEHKQKELNKFNKMFKKNNKYDFKFGEHENWCVKPVEVLP